MLLWVRPLCDEVTRLRAGVEAAHGWLDEATPWLADRRDADALRLRVERVVKEVARLRAVVGALEFLDREG